VAAVEADERRQRVAIGLHQGARGEPRARARCETTIRRAGSLRFSSPGPPGHLRAVEASTQEQCGVSRGNSLFVKIRRFRALFRTRPESGSPLKQAGELRDTGRPSTNVA
jgi:hypothetical protein